MKKPNRRSKRSSDSDSSPPAAVGDDKGQERQQQHYATRVEDLEKENEALKREIEELKQKSANLSPVSLDRNQKVDGDSLKLRALDDQVTELKKKFNCLSELSLRKQNSSQKQKGGVAGILSQDEIHRLKVQKVQLLCKMKLESVQFRLSKASLEKEVLQLKKDQRRKDYENRKLLAQNEKQKLVLQRKTEEASVATKRLNELLESRKTSSHKNSDSQSGKSHGIQGMEIELKIAARVEEIRADYEQEMEEMADELRKYEEEAEMLRQENFRCLLLTKEEECQVRDSEFKDLKEEISRLSNLVNQLGMPKAAIKKLDMDPVKPSLSSISSIEFTDMPESECSVGNNAAFGKSTPKACCSCSKKSLCKTSKCECRAGGSSCGNGCGCTTSKCTNRAALVIQVDDSLNQKEAQDSFHSLGNSESEKVIVSQPSDLDNDDVPGRKPLHEIGNTMVKTSPATKTGNKMRRQQPVSSEAENAGLKRAETIPRAANQKRVTRAKRSQISKDA